MKKLLFVAVLVSSVLMTSETVRAGEGADMKCRTEKCGYESFVSIGGGMMFGQITGFCVPCKKFVYLSWTLMHSPLVDATKTKIIPEPKSLGKIWDAKTGRFLDLYGCPDCKAPFVQVNSFNDIKHCPVCNEATFAIDPSKPRMAID